MPRPIASIFLLAPCDLACRFCASEADFDTMSFAQAEAVVREAVTAGARNVVLGGGEPLLWPHDLERLAARAKELGAFVQVCTNGTRLTAELAASEAVDRWILPLESADASVHDALRRRRGGHHHVAEAGIEQVLAAGRELTVATVVTAHNADGLADLRARLLDLHARGARLHAWHLYRFVPVGRGGRPNAEELALDACAFDSACARVRREELPFAVYRRPDMTASKSVAFWWLEDGRLRVMPSP